MSRTKKICYLSMLTALYVVLSAFVKINLIGNIQIDLGYIAFAVSLCMFGVYGTVVGVIGCALESVLFSAYGFSISWAVANAIIGIGCGLLYHKNASIFWKSFITIVFALLGVLAAKTAIECCLYSIPVAVKIPKNTVAFSADSASMIIGLFIYNRNGMKKNTQSYVASY